VHPFSVRIRSLQLCLTELGTGMKIMRDLLILAIALGIAGIVILILTIILCVVCFRRRRRQTRDKTPGSRKVETVEENLRTRCLEQGHIYQELEFIRDEPSLTLRSFSLENGLDEFSEPILLGPCLDRPGSAPTQRRGLQIPGTSQWATPTVWEGEGEDTPPVPPRGRLRVSPYAVTVLNQPWEYENTKAWRSRAKSTKQPVMGRQALEVRGYVKEDKGKGSQNISCLICKQKFNTASHLKVSI
jgi:hypothetical protein